MNLLMVTEPDHAKKLFARAVTSFAAFNKARLEVREIADTTVKAMAWNVAISEYCKVTKFLSETARKLGRNSWADAILAEQRSSSTLNYLLHSRNADSHGMEEVTANGAARLSIGGIFSFEGDFSSINLSGVHEYTTMPDGTRKSRSIDGSFSIKDGAVSSGWLSSEAPVVTKLKYLKLRPVMDRGVSYAVPATHAPPEVIADELIQKAYNWLDSKIKAIDPSK